MQLSAQSSAKGLLSAIIGLNQGGPRLKQNEGESWLVLRVVIWTGADLRGAKRHLYMPASFCIDFLWKEEEVQSGQQMVFLIRKQESIQTFLGWNICSTRSAYLQNTSIRPWEAHLFACYPFFDSQISSNSECAHATPPPPGRKVETAGDCYIVSGGIMSPTNQANGGLGIVVEDHDRTESAMRVMEFAKAMLEVAQQVGCCSNGRCVHFHRARAPRSVLSNADLHWPRWFHLRVQRTFVYA
eukprot:1148717-Pelagomonas_calceolata.AAC.3